MLDLSLFGLALLALLAVWKFMLRPAIQDTFKDQLFDVRDKVRCDFAERGQLGTLAYEELRDTLNGYIRFIEVANLARAYRFTLALSAQPDVAAAYFQKLDRRFELRDADLARLVHASRKRCNRIIQFYLFHSSFFSVITIYFFMVPAALLKEIGKLCRSRAARSWKSLRLNVQTYVQAREDRAIQPHHTELFSQVERLQLA